MLQRNYSDNIWRI